VVPHCFPWTKERLILSWAESTPSLHSPRARLPMQNEIAWLLLCYAAMLGLPFIAPHLLKEHLGGKSIKKKLSPKGGGPLEMYGRGSSKESSYIARSVCGAPLSPTCETVRRETVVLTLLPIRWQSSTLAGEP
jgi:hypothetical protein